MSNPSAPPRLRSNPIGGLARGIGALNLGMIGKIFLSWIVTLPVGAVLSIIFFLTLRGIFT